MPLTIQTTITCTSKQSFNLMVDGVIEAMSSSSASGCALALVDLRQRRRDRAEWIFGWTVRSVVDEAFDQVLSDHPDLCDAVNAQVSVFKCLVSVIQVTHHGNIIRHRCDSSSSIVHYHYRDATSHIFYPCCLTTSCNPYKLRTVSDTQCAGMEETLKCFSEDKGN